jgi:hypothetical protein
MNITLSSGVWGAGQQMSCAKGLLSWLNLNTKLVFSSMRGFVLVCGRDLYPFGQNMVTL